MDFLESFTLSYFQGASKEEQRKIVQDNLRILNMRKTEYEQWVSAIKSEVEEYSGGQLALIIDGSLVELENISLKECEMPLAIRFVNVNLDNRIVFLGVNFLSDFHIERFEIEGSISIVNCKFESEFNIKNSNLFGLEFDTTHIKGNVVIKDVFFRGELNIRGGSFCRRLVAERGKLGGNFNAHSAVFLGLVDFSFSELGSNVDIYGSTFKGGFIFGRLGMGRFYRTDIPGHLCLRDNLFESNFSIRNIEVRGNASFENCCFNELANFSTFNTNSHTSFARSNFKGSVNFNDSKLGSCVFTDSDFLQTADFSGCHFEGVPDFNFASFKQEPNLEGVIIPFENQKSDKAAIKYRKLKSLAQSSKDNDNALKFFGYEMLSKARQRDLGLSKKIFIYGYLLFSNFGQSLKRPVVGWFLWYAIVFFLNISLIQPNKAYCEQNGLRNFEHQVATYSLSNTLPLYKIDKAQQLEVNKCLFGESSFSFYHSLWNLMQLLPSALFIFLFGLAVRNKFKIF